MIFGRMKVYSKFLEHDGTAEDICSIEVNLFEISKLGGEREMAPEMASAICPAFVQELRRTPRESEDFRKLMFVYKAIGESCISILLYTKLHLYGDRCLSNQ